MTVNQDKKLNLNFEDSCAYIEAITNKMLEASSKDDLSGLLKLNKLVDKQLREISMDELSPAQKNTYKIVLETFYKNHCLLMQKCKAAFKESEKELVLLRKQQLAENIYQQIQGEQ